jgi:hypothetical protein
MGGNMGAPFTSKGMSAYEAQTSVAADKKGNVVAAWIAFFSDNTSSIGYAVSHDGGVGWTAPAYIKSPGGRLASSPVVAADSQGRFSLAWLGFMVTGNTDEHVYLSKLDDKDAFGAPAVASDDGTSTTRDFDKPGIAIDANDNVLLTWADFTTPGMAALTFARTSDGTTFTRSTIVNDATFGNLAYLCLDASAGPSAPLYLVHLGGGGTLIVRKSTDQGKTWSLGGAPTASNVVFQDPTCVAHGNDLYVAYGSGTALFMPSLNTPADEIDVIHSADGGGKFSAPVVVSDGGAGVQYLFPQIARSAGGKLEIAYYQGVTNMPATVSHAVSDAGATWKVSSLGSAGTFALDRTLASWLGDYLGAASPAGTAFVSYTENSAGKSHIGFAKVASP